MRALEREGAIGAAERRERVVRALDGALEALGAVLEAARHQRDLERGLVGDMLVEARRLDPEAGRHGAHGERVGAALLEQRERGIRDLALPLRGAVSHAGGRPRRA